MFEDALEAPDEAEMLLNRRTEAKKTKVEHLDKLLGFSHQASPPTYVPSCLAVSQAWDNIETVTTPVVLKTENGGTYQVQTEYDPIGVSQSFWDIVQKQLKTVALGLSDEAFGTVLPAKVEGLDLANGFFPNLLSRSGSLRYTAATNRDNRVGKTQYRTYLDCLDRSLQYLRKTAKQDLQNTNTANQATMTGIGTKLLEGVPRAWVSSAEHQTILAGHELLLAHSAESIRRELVGLGIVTSKAAESTLLRDAKTRSLAGYTFTLLDRYLTAPVTSKAPGTCETPEASRAPVAGGSNQEVGGKGTQPAVSVERNLRLPTLFVQQILDGHLCHCDICDPGLLTTIHHDADLRAKQEFQANLSAELKDQWLEELRAECLEEARERLRTAAWEEVFAKEKADMETQEKSRLMQEAAEEWKADERFKIKRELVAELMKSG
jgi:hypothetical protein